MDRNNLERVIEEHIDRIIDAKLIPSAEMVDGLEVTTGHIFKILIERGAIERDAIIDAMNKAVAAVPEGKRIILHHLRQAIGDIPESPTATHDQNVRPPFRLIPGGLARVDVDGQGMSNV